MEIEATVSNHPDADAIFAAAFTELDLNKIFPGGNVVKVFNIPCKLDRDLRDTKL